MEQDSLSCSRKTGAFCHRLLLKWQCIIVILVFLSVATMATPPEDPVKCVAGNKNCTVTNSYGMFPDRATCRASGVVYPTSESELVSVVAAAVKSRQMMRVVTRFSHSIPKLACTDGEDGLLISTKFLNHTIKTDVTMMTLTVESGVTLRQLIDEAAKVGLALPYAPYWWGLTVGGLLGTGAHGSSLWGKGSAVHDHVQEIRIVSPGDARDGFVMWMHQLNSLIMVLKIWMHQLSSLFLVLQRLLLEKGCRMKMKTQLDNTQRFY